jgi:flagellar protein FlgJ
VTDPLSSFSTPVSSATTGASKADAKLKTVAKQFEAVFLRQMIGSMRSASLSDGMFDSSATQQFRDMSDSRLADSMADKSVLHVAELLVKQFGATISGGATAAGNAAPATGSALPVAAAAPTKGESE